MSTGTITITKRLEFDYGHRLLKHESRCSSIHGHRGVVVLTVRADSGQLDGVGRVIDFSKIKELVGGWLDQHWDHAFIFQDGDPVGEAVVEDGKRYFVMAEPPTAENLVQIVVHAAAALLNPLGMSIDRVEFFETPTSSAVWVPPAHPLLPHG